MTLLSGVQVGIYIYTINHDESFVVLLLINFEVHDDYREKTLIAVFCSVNSAITVENPGLKVNF